MKQDNVPRDGQEAEVDSARLAREDIYSVEAALRAAGAEVSLEQDALSRILKVLELVNAELDIERVLNLAAQQVIEIFEAERVFFVDLGPGDKVRFRLAVSFDGLPTANPAEEVSHAIIREVVRERRAMLVKDAGRDARFADVSSVRNLELRSVMVAPLLARGTLLGAIYVENRRVAGAFDARTLDLLSVFANHVAVALRNAQLFRELTAARAEAALSERLRAIGQVAAFVAHEVKNPLASIRILLDSLREKWPDPDFRAMLLDVIPKEVRRLDGAVNQILEYARPSPLIKVPVALSALLDSCLRTLAPEIERGGVLVTKRYEPNIPPVLADGERLREVFMNILKNGLEAVADSGRKELRVRVGQPDETREEAILEDSGPGIPEGEMESIFEPFRSLKKGGSGLGLALCQKVVREHGGRITVENIPTGGARFRITLPISGA